MQAHFFCLHRKGFSNSGLAGAGASKQEICCKKHNRTGNSCNDSAGRAACHEIQKNTYLDPAAFGHPCRHNEVRAMSSSVSKPWHFRLKSVLLKPNPDLPSLLAGAVPWSMRRNPLSSDTYNPSWPIAPPLNGNFCAYSQ